MRFRPALGCVAGAWACARPTVGPCERGLPHEAPVGTGQNVMLVVLDDFGTDRFAAWPEATHPVPTPHLDALAAQGVTFTSAYADTTCSPTRATLLTGRRPRRHGVGRFVDSRDEDQPGLPDAEVTIPELLRASPTGPWATALMGKWHLDQLRDADAPFGPLDQGFDHHRGTLANPNAQYSRDLERPLDYWNWEYAVDGAVRPETRYLTTVTTDDALDALATLPEPWFLQVAYNAAHEPFHAPPPELLPAPVPADAPAPALFDAMLQSVDHELGRLFAAVDLSDTLLIVLSDNGTPKEALWERSGGHKATVREQGVHVPMWIAGVGVAAPGSTSDAFVYAADVFATVADVASVDLRGADEGIDGRSLLPFLEDPSTPGRRCLVVEQFPENGRPDHRLGRSIRDHDHLVMDVPDFPPALRETAQDRIGDGSLVPRDRWTDADRDAFRRLRDLLRDDARFVR